MIRHKAVTAKRAGRPDDVHVGCEVEVSRTVARAHLPLAADLRLAVDLPTRRHLHVVDAAGNEVILAGALTRVDLALNQGMKPINTCKFQILIFSDLQLRYLRLCVEHVVVDHAVSFRPVRHHDVSADHLRGRVTSAASEREVAAIAVEVADELQVHFVAAHLPVEVEVVAQLLTVLVRLKIGQPQLD